MNSSFPFSYSCPLVSNFNSCSREYSVFLLS
jgi:hypothetical protein